MEDDIPITDPTFYSNEKLCSDSDIAAVFAAATHCAEGIPLLKERIQVMREVGSILCKVNKKKTIKKEPMLNIAC